MRQHSWMEDSLPLYLRNEALKTTASKIRDDLDPIIAQEGPHALDANEAIALNNILIGLQRFQASLHALRYSRIHLAILEIRGIATRWPSTLIDQADLVVESLEKIYGSLRLIQPLLYSEGGRLYDVCKPEDTSKVNLFLRFSKASPIFVDERRAYIAGSMGFPAGSGNFAFRDGVIDKKSLAGRICHNNFSAYAIVLGGTSELDSLENPDKFSLEASQKDRGFFCLTNPKSVDRKLGLRVFRTHSLSSRWAPIAGFRYDGQYKVSGWTTIPANTPTPALSFHYKVHFERMEKSNWHEFLSHPKADELDDYRLYKTIISHQRRKPDKSPSNDIYTKPVKECLQAQTFDFKSIITESKLTPVLEEPSVFEKAFASQFNSNTNRPAQGQPETQ